MTFGKTPEEIAIMREGGKKLGTILQQLLAMAEVGVSLNQLEDRAEALIAASGGAASFKTVEGYRWATCLCVNEVVVHGIPSEYILADGDILTIDIGLLYQGFHTDTAWTKIIQNSKGKMFGKAENFFTKGESIQNYEEKQKFLRVGEEALWKAIEEAKIGNRIGHISAAIQSTIEGAGYSIVKTLVGHGVGHELHEAPQIPGFLKGPVAGTLLLEEGMTLAIEVIYAQGSGAVGYANTDGWTIATRDSSLSAVFEHTIVISAGVPAVLTRSASFDKAQDESSGSTLSKIEGLTKTED